MFSLHRPCSTSLAELGAFNNENDKFFEITDIAHKKQQYTSYCVFSVDETGLTVD